MRNISGFYIAIGYFRRCFSVGSLPGSYLPDLFLRYSLDYQFPNRTLRILPAYAMTEQVTTVPPVTSDLLSSSVWASVVTVTSG